MITAKKLISVKCSLDNVYLTESIVNPNKKIQVLFEASEWRGVLTQAEVRKLNKVYDKYLSQASLLYEGVGYRSPIVLWEHFLRLEDKVNLNESFADLWDRAKSAASKVGSAVGGAYKKVRRAASAATMEKVFGGSKKDKAQAAEFSGLDGAAKAMTDAVYVSGVGDDAEFPNNDTFEDFQNQLVAAVEAGLEYIEKNCKNKDKKVEAEATAKEIVNMKKWISFTADHKLGERYRFFKGGHRDVEKDDRQLESFHRKNLKYLYEAAAAADTSKVSGPVSNPNAIGTSADESAAWKGMNSKTLEKILLGTGIFMGVAAIAMLIPSLLAALKKPSTSAGPDESWEEKVKEWSQTSTKVHGNFRVGLSRGIMDMMKNKGLNSDNWEAVEGFYKAHGDGTTDGFFNKLADLQGKTGAEKAGFLKRMAECARDHVLPKDIGYTSGSPEMRGDIADTFLSVHNKDIEMTGTYGDFAYKTVKRVIVGAAITHGAGGMVVAAGLAAAAPVVGAAAVVLVAGWLLVKWLKNHGKTSSRLQVLMSVFDKIDAVYKEAGGQTEQIPAAPPTPGATPPTDSPPAGGTPGGSGPPNRDQIAAVILKVLKTKKFKKKPNLEKISNKVADALIAGKPTDAAAVEKIVVANMKNIAAKTKQEVIDAVISFFEKEDDDLGEEEEDDNDVEEETETTGAELRKATQAAAARNAANIIGKELNLPTQKGAVKSLALFLSNEGIITERRRRRNFLKSLTENDFELDNSGPNIDIDVDRSRDSGTFNSKIYTGDVEKYNFAVLNSVYNKCREYFESSEMKDLLKSTDPKDSWNKKYTDSKIFANAALSALIKAGKLINVEQNQMIAGGNHINIHDGNIRDFANGNIIVERWQRLAGIIC